MFGGFQGSNSLFNSQISSSIKRQNDTVQYSLNDMLTFEDIGSRVFFVQLNHQSSLNGKYVQVKRQAYNDRKIDVLQIIDISAQIMYDIADGEKKLLALINATVSHEMRNPTNSIYSQVLKQTYLAEKLKDIISKNKHSIGSSVKKRLLSTIEEF